jgi:hypothetical protein
MKRERPVFGGRAGGETRELSLSVFSHAPDSTSSGDTSPLQRFALRASALVDRVASGELAFLDAVDSAYDYGVALGVSDEESQLVLAAAFALAHVRRTRRAA